LSTSAAIAPTKVFAFFRNTSGHPLWRSEGKRFNHEGTKNTKDFTKKVGLPVEREVLKNLLLRDCFVFFVPSWLDPLPSAPRERG